MSTHDRDYEPLLAKDEEDDNTRAVGEGRYPPSSSPPPSYPTSPLTLRAILNRPTLFFAFSCLLAFALSAVNMTVLSTSDSFSAYTMERQPKRFPTVYAGLEKVTWDTNRCRTRTTYPVEYATFEGDNVSGKKRVHAPRDEVVFSFGGKTSALVTFYIPDYALETCTLVFPVVYPTHTITSGYDSSAGVGGRAGPLRRDGGHSKKEPVMLTRPDYMNSTTSANINSQSVLEVSVLASPNTLRDRKRSSPISLRPVFGKDGNVTSASFACKSQSRVSLQITCPGDCRWEFGLQGMTIQSSSTKSLAKTGFHLQQYEGIECVK